MQNGVALIDENPETSLSEQPEQSTASPVYRECPLSDQSIFYEAEEANCQGWFLRIQVTGMYPRRCGPFATREGALGFLDNFISRALMNAFSELENQITVGQAYVVEGHVSMGN
jgi:hypothetical protein